MARWSCRYARLSLLSIGLDGMVNDSRSWSVVAATDCLPMTITSLLPALLLALIPAACNGPLNNRRPGTNDTAKRVDSTTGRHSPTLVGTSWRLGSYETRAKGIVVGDSRTFRTTLQFNDSLNCGGNTGCNGYGGDYRADSPSVGQISFGPMIQTEMYCEDVGAFESMYTSAFITPLAYQLDADSLHLTVPTPKSDSAIAVLHFVRKQAGGGE